MLVYRLEHAETREGPFRYIDPTTLDEDTLERWDVICKRADKLPLADEDLGIDDVPDFFAPEWAFGCASLQQFSWWFSTNWQFLQERLGFVLRVYEVLDYFVVKGDYQVAYDPLLGGEVETLTYEEYLVRLEIERKRISRFSETSLPDPTPGFVSSVTPQT